MLPWLFCFKLHIMRTLVLHAPRFQDGTRENENALPNLGFLKGMCFEKLKKHAQWIISAAENNATETAPDHQDHMPTTPGFLFQNTLKRPDACRILTSVTQDSNCSCIQFLSRVCVVGILHESKSQRYHSRL